MGITIRLLIELVFIKSSNEFTDRFTWRVSGLLVELITSDINMATDVGWEHYDIKPALFSPFAFREWTE
jgi:hypothetical protein